MELRHLRYFITVAEELHFARAAERLQMAQQPLSASIRRLEEELSVTLFERSTRRVALTEAGRIFLDRAYQTLHTAEQAVQAAQEAERGARGEIRVGYGSTTLYNVTPPLIRAFRERYPHVRVILRETAFGCTPEMDEHILSSNLDVVLMGLPTRAELLESVVLCSEPVYVVLPEHHRLAALAEIPLYELDNEPFVQYDRVEKLSVNQQIVSAFYEAGLTLNNVQEATSEQAIIGLVAAGLGVSVVSASLKGLRQTEVVYRRLIEPSVEIEFNLLWRRDGVTPVTRSFIELAQEMFVDLIPA
jgi:DNA-binding transcriptional LysR family regulator